MRPTECHADDEAKQSAHENTLNAAIESSTFQTLCAANLTANGLAEYAHESAHDFAYLAHKLTE